MKYYKSNDGKVYAYELDGSQDAYITPDLILMTAAEVELHTNPIKTVVELKTLQIASVNTKFIEYMTAITSGYPTDEMLSWSKQETEARSWLAVNSAITPLIDGLAAARSIPKSNLVDRIIAKADAFAGISGQLIGKRQSLEDRINALPTTATPQEIAAIVW